MHFYARRVENICVVGAPEVFHLVARRRGRARHAGGEGKTASVPVRAAIRRQNRPAHGSKAIGEKGRVVLDDVVLRLEPGDEPFLRAVLDFAETDKGAHLVDVVPDGFLEVGRLRDVGIDRDLEQMRLAVRQPPEQPIEQRPARRVANGAKPNARARGNVSGTRISPRPVASAGGFGFVEKLERGLVFADFFPGNFFRRETVLQGAARDRLPARERRQKGDLLHGARVARREPRARS